MDNLLKKKKEFLIYDSFLSKITDLMFFKNRVTIIILSSWFAIFFKKIIKNCEIFFYIIYLLLVL